MKPKAKKFYEWFIVVAGSGMFPIDMLRYDSAFPYREEDSSKCKESAHERRRIVLCRRGVNEVAGSKRWESFGWHLVFASTDAGEAVAEERKVEASP